MVVGVICIALLGCSNEEPAAYLVDASAGHHISVQESQKRLLKFVHTLSSEESTRAESDFSKFGKITSVKILDKEKHLISRASEEASYYVFLFENNEGFAVMSADDRLPDLLAIGKGTPNPNDPNDVLPDGDIWTPPTVNDTATNNPIHPPLDSYDDVPHTTAWPINTSIKTYWGQGEPYNKYLREIDSQYYDIPDSIEVRAATEIVAIAQLMTLTRLRGDYLDKLANNINTADTLLREIDFNKISKCRSKEAFLANPELADQVAKWYLWFILDGKLNYGYRDIKYDKDKNVRYIEMIISDLTIGDIQEPYEKIRDVFAKLGLSYTNKAVYYDYRLQSVFNSLKDGAIIIMHPCANWLQICPQDWFIVDNAMYFDHDPDNIYFRVNYGKDGERNGYYLSSGFDNINYYRTIKR